MQLNKWKGNRLFSKLFRVYQKKTQVESIRNGRVPESVNSCTWRYHVGFWPTILHTCSFLNVFRMLVISAEQNFECSEPKLKKKKNNLPTFSRQLTDAYYEQKEIWNNGKRLVFPETALTLLKCRMEQISQDDCSVKAINLHNELMETHHTNMSQVCGKLKQIRGESSKGCEIPYI